jgi:hypothetical protein
MRGTIIGLAVLGVFALVVVLVVSGGTKVPDGPVPVAWDREPCEHCRMSIGEPRHAAQLITTEGRVFNFDDIGCAIALLRSRSPAVHRLWFRGDGDRWIGADAVGFARTDITPMGSGLLAVDRGAPDARSWEVVLRDHVNPSAPSHGGQP